MVSQPNPPAVLLAANAAQSASHPMGDWLALTMGDACGIGPEIIARLWQQGAVQDAVVVGDPAVMQYHAADQLNIVMAHSKNAN